MAVTLSVLAGPRPGSAGRLHTRTGSGTLHEQVDSKRLLYMLTATPGPKINRTRARRPLPSSLVGWVGSQQPHTSKPAIDLLTYINAQLIVGFRPMFGLI